MTLRPFLSLALAAACSAAGAADFVQPGLWEQQTLLSADGKSWRPGTQSKGCLTKEQAGEWVSHVEAQIAATGCTASKLRVAGGKVDADIACPSQNQSRLLASGEYSDAAYSVNLVSDSTVGASPVRVFAKWTGKRLGDCRP